VRNTIHPFTLSGKIDKEWLINLRNEIGFETMDELLNYLTLRSYLFSPSEWEDIHEAYDEYVEWESARFNSDWHKGIDYIETEVDDESN